MPILDFEELTEGTLLGTQYQASGVTFVEPPQRGPLPFVTTLPSGKKALHIRGSGEIAWCEARASFDKPRRHVTLVLVNERDMAASADLFALDIAGNTLASSTVSLAGATGATATIAIERPSEDMHSFVVKAPSTHHRVAIDVLAFNDGAAAAGPDFGLSASFADPLGLSCRPGGSVEVKVHVVRAGGSTGPVLLSVEGLPSGVTGVFLPAAPGAPDDQTLRLMVANEAPASSLAKLRIVGKPASPAVGSAQRSTEVIFSIVGYFQIANLTADLPPFTTMSFAVQVSIPASGFGSTVGWSGAVTLAVAAVPALPPGVQVKIASPVAQLSPAAPSTTVMVEVRDDSGLTAGSFAFGLVGSSPPFGPAGARVELRRVAARLTGFQPGVGDGPRQLRPGSEITLSGTGFGAGASVQFGNEKAVAKAHWVAPDGKSARVHVPRLGTTGPLTVISPAGKTTSTGSLVVRTYRNNHGFSFGNPPITGGVNYGELSDAFGKEQTWVTVSFDPCDGIPIVGWFVDCDVQVSFFPHPLGLVVLAMAQQLDACCFGMSLSTVRFLRGDSSRAGFAPAGAQRTWDLTGPAAPSAALHRQIFLTSLQQLGSEFMRNWLGNLLVAFDPTSGRVGESLAAKKALKELLAAGEHPLISMRNGGKGHLVVACDVEDASESGVAYYIHIYDPNVPFLKSEDGDAASHETSEISNSRITVRSDGTWQFPGLGGWGPFGFHTASETLVVCPYAVTPLRPTFPASVEGLMTLVFGSATTVQLESAAGHRLIAEDGSLNQDPQSRLAAAPFAPLSGRGAEAVGHVLAEEMPLTWTLQGTEEGTCGAIVLGRRLALKLDELPVSGRSRDQIGHDPERQSFTFATSEKSKPLAVTLVARAGDDTFRTITLETTTFGEGSESLRYDAERDAVVYRHEGPATRCTIKLGWTGTDALPSSFVARDLEVLPGQETRLRPASWRKLEREPVMLATRTPEGHGGKTELRSEEPRVRPEVALRAGPAEGGFQVDIEARLPPSEPWASLIVSWAIRHGEEVELRGTQVIDQGLSEGSVTHSFHFEPRHPGRYELVVHVRGVGAGLPAIVCGTEARLVIDGDPGKVVIKPKHPIKLPEKPVEAAKKPPLELPKKPVEAAKKPPLELPKKPPLELPKKPPHK